MASSDPVATALITAASSYDLWGTQCQSQSETRFTYKEEHDGRPAFESADGQYKKYLYFSEEIGAWCIGSELGGSFIGVKNRDGLAPSPPSSGWQEFCGEEWIASDLVICASPSDVGACVSPPEHALGNNSDLPPLYPHAPFLALMVTMPFTATVFGDAGDPAWTDGRHLALHFRWDCVTGHLQIIQTHVPSHSFGCPGLIRALPAQDLCGISI